MSNQTFMSKAIELANQCIDQANGGPFGAVIVRNGQIVGQGSNCVTSHNDPTAHAEISAIRDACKNLKTFSLDGCDIYTSCEPCPMCLGAIYWARINTIFYAANRNDAAKIGFDDQFFYDELVKPIDERSIPMHVIDRESALAVFNAWENKLDKIHY